MKAKSIWRMFREDMPIISLVPFINLFAYVIYRDSYLSTKALISFLLRPPD